VIPSLAISSGSLSSLSFSDPHRRGGIQYFARSVHGASETLAEKNLRKTTDPAYRGVGPIPTNPDTPARSVDGELLQGISPPGRLASPPGSIHRDCVTSSTFFADPDLAFHAQNTDMRAWRRRPTSTFDPADCGRHKSGVNHAARGEASGVPSVVMEAPYSHCLRLHR
jgi:hypothetical protein